MKATTFSIRALTLAAALVNAVAWGADAPLGKSVYQAGCIACHGTGVAGAPKVGDAAAWAPRIKTGLNALYGSAMKGKGAMPARGGNSALPDEAVQAAVNAALVQR